MKIALLAISIAVYLLEPALYASEPNIQCHYLIFEQCIGLDQVWALVRSDDNMSNEMKSDTVFLHVRRVGPSITFRTIGSPKNFVFSQARVAFDSVAHIEKTGHMSLDYFTKFLLQIDSSQVFQGSRLLVVMHGNSPELTFNVPPSPIHSRGQLGMYGRQRTYKIAASTPFDKSEPLLLLPTSCIMSLGRWVVLSSEVGRHLLDTVCITVDSLNVVVTTIGHAGDTTSTSTIPSSAVNGGNSSWSVGFFKGAHKELAKKMFLDIHPQTFDPEHMGHSAAVMLRPHRHVDGVTTSDVKWMAHLFKSAYLNY